MMFIRLLISYNEGNIYIETLLSLTSPSHCCILMSAAKTLLSLLYYV